MKTWKLEALIENNAMMRDTVDARQSLNTTVSSYRKEGKFGSYSCGHCDAYCVYNAVEIAFTIGVIANLLVIIRVARDTRLRDPTFIGMAALALADLLFLTHNLTVSFETVISSFTCKESVLISRPWYIMNSMFWFAANSHVALLAVIRYISLANPLRASVFLRPTRVIMMSAGVWILGMLLLGTLAGLITLKIIVPGTSSEFIIIWWITVYLLPLIVTIVLHIMKICLVRRSIVQSSSNSEHRKLVNRMSSIVVIVVVLATVLPLPLLIFNCLRVAGNAFPSKSFRTHFQGIAQMVFLINHFINPFMYAFLSRRFRNSLKDMFFGTHRSKTNISETTESQLSTRVQSVAMENVGRAHYDDEDLHGNISTIHAIAGYNIMVNPPNCDM